MANQPSKYSKFLVGAASAALVAVAVAPAASAADFSDTKGNTHEEAINALSAAGVISGYPDGTFQPNKTLTRSDVVKLLGKWLVSEGFEIPADAVSNPRFTDLKSTSNKELLEYAAVVKDNGVFNGSNGRLLAGDNITRENMAVVLVRAFDSVNGIDLVSYVDEQTFKADVKDLNSAKSEAQGAINVLDFFDITNPAVSNFNPKGNTTRGHFATFLHKSIETDFSAVTGVASSAVESIKAVNSTTVEVTFKEAVSDVKATDFKIEGLTVSNAVTKQENAKTIVLTTTAQEGGKKYEVTYGAKAIGSFVAVSTVIPTKITVEETAVQAVVGKEVTLKANIGVKEAGVPVTFNVDARETNLNKDIVAEVLTDANGVATFSYTQYNAGLQDDVAVYASGAPAVRDFVSVHWGVDTILKIEADDKKGNELKNGENKVYKVTYKDPKTGKPVVNKELNVTFAENVDVAINKITHATANGKLAYQTTNDKTEAVVIKTDSKGEATITVSGTNTKATPIVFVDNKSAGENTVAKDIDKLDRTELNVKAAELTFGAIHLKYEMEVTRDGGEEASVITSKNDNGRVYKVVVKDENGKAASKEVVNVALDEVLDKVISTNTNARFLIDNDDLAGESKYRAGSNDQQIEIELNSKGEGEFRIISSKETDYATPVVWIDINTASNKDGVLEEGEPKKVAAMTIFAEEEIEGSRLKVWDAKEVKDNRTIVGNTAEFRFAVANQSGKEFAGVSSNFKATFKVENTGTKDVYVWDNKADADAGKIETALNGKKPISTRRSETITLPSRDGKVASLFVSALGESATVEVTAYGEVTDADKKVVRLSESKVAKATFKSGSDLNDSETRKVTAFNRDKKKITLAGKEELDFKEEYDANDVRYIDARGTSDRSLGFEQFADYIDAGLASAAGISVHYYKDSNGVITFKIVNDTTGGNTGDSSVLSKVNAATTSAQVKAAVQNTTEYLALTDAGKATAEAAILTALNGGTVFNAATLSNALKPEVRISAAYTAAVQATTGDSATVEFVSGANKLEIKGNAGNTDFNGVTIKFAKGTEATIDHAYTVADKTLTILLPVNAVTGELAAVNLDQVTAEITAWNANLTKAYTGYTGTEDATVLLGKSLVLNGATASVAASADKLVLTFSEAVTGGVGAAITVGTTATTGTSTLSADGLKLTIEGTNVAVTATSVLTNLQGVTIPNYSLPVGAGAAKSLVYPTTITLK